MVYLKRHIQAISLFFVGFFSIHVLNEVLSPLLTALAEIFTNSDMDAAVQSGLVILYLIVLVAGPLFLSYLGIVERNEDNPRKTALIATLISIFGLIATTLMYNWFTTFASLTTDSFLLALYWVGMIGTWLMIIVVTPVYAWMQTRDL